jgi:hypothetical protein
VLAERTRVKNNALKYVARLVAMSFPVEEETVMQYLTK